MLDGTNDGLGEMIAINEGLQTDGAAVLESTELELFEKQYISGVDEVRINETAGIMAEVFSEDVISGWSEFSLDEKSGKLNEYYVRAGESLGINTKGVIVEPMYSGQGTTMGCNAGDGYIHLNRAIVENPGMLGQVLDTATHEMRHQFQMDALTNPLAFSDIPGSVMGIWDYEFRNYINADYDYQGYYEQLIECDARDFAADVMKSYSDKMNFN